MNKMDKLIMGIKNSILFGNKEKFQGYISHENKQLEQIVLENFEYQRRGNLEEDLNYKQPITYTVLIDNKTHDIFVYRRSSNSEHYGEKKLFNKLSWGVGGHIEVEDKETANPIESAAKREVTEEANIKDPKLLLLGYINDESNDVGKVHFGILYICFVDSSEVSLEDGENIHGEFLGINQIEEMIKSGNYDIEEWSKIILNPIKTYIESTLNS